MDVTFCEADEMDASSLACVVGRVSEDGPVQQPNLKRLRELLNTSEKQVMLVAGPEKVSLECQQPTMQRIVYQAAMGLHFHGSAHLQVIILQITSGGNL